MRYSVLVAAAALAAAPLLSSCSAAGGGFERQITELADRGEAFVLPQDSAPVSPWAAVAVLCPYDDAAQLPEPFAQTAAGIDTTASDASQWLVFDSTEDVKTLVLSRERIDFCGSPLEGEQVFAAETEWKAVKRGDTWSVRVN